MKIAFLNDFSTGEFIGGANNTGSLWIKKGTELGHSITEYNRHLTEEDAKDLKEYDLVILNNINAFKLEVIDWIIKNFRYVKVEHDYSFCEFRNANCESCKSRPCIIAQVFKDIFSHSLLNIFFSPLQLDIQTKYFGELLRDAIVLPPPMEKGKWKKGVMKEDAYLFVGAIQNNKGIHQILDWADTRPNDKFVFAGKVVSKPAFDRIKTKHTYLGEVPHDEIPALMMRHKYFVINPQMHESFGLTPIEAIASGCKVIKFAKSKLTGMESYNLPTSKMLELCYESPDNFWALIGKLDE